MHTEAQTIARLKSMVFLVEEALRIADEGDNPLLGAKLSDCIDCLVSALAQVRSESDDVPASTEANAALPNDAIILSI